MGTASASFEQSALTSEFGTVVPERRSVHVGQHHSGSAARLRIFSSLSPVQPGRLWKERLQSTQRR